MLVIRSVQQQMSLANISFRCLMATTEYMRLVPPLLTHGTRAIQPQMVHVGLVFIWLH